MGKYQSIIVKLSDQGNCNREVVGGKFAALSRLASNRFNIPNAICLTTDAFSMFINSIDCAPDLAKLQSLDLTVEPENSLRIINEMSQEIKQSAIPNTIDAALLSFLDDLEYPLAIRSSACIEDGENMSFAGVFESYVGISNPADLKKAILECWASFFQPQVYNYLAFHKAQYKGGMAVICQNMISAECSGVAFTYDPIRKRKVMLIDGCWGQSGPLVRGEITPDHFEVNTNGEIIARTLGTKKIVEEYKNQVIQRRPTSEQESRLYSLTDKQLTNIFKVASKIEMLFGFPQDIEWGFKNNKLYLFQARPITGA